MSSKSLTRFGLPVQEATETLVIPLLQVDVDEGVNPDDVNADENFLSCVIAHAVTRVAGADRVAIMHTVGYIAFPGENVTRRYLLDHASRKIVEAWDRGEEVKEGVQIRLLPPNKQNSLGAMREANRNKRVRKKRRKTMRGVVRNGNIVRWN